MKNCSLENDDGFVEDMDLGDDVVERILASNNEESVQEIMDRDPTARKRRNFVTNLLHGKVGKWVYRFKLGDIKG